MYSYTIYIIDIWSVLVINNSALKYMCCPWVYYINVAQEYNVIFLSLLLLSYIVVLIRELGNRSHSTISKPQNNQLEFSK